MGCSASRTRTAARTSPLRNLLRCLVRPNPCWPKFTVSPGALTVPKGKSLPNGDFMYTLLSLGVSEIFSNITTIYHIAARASSSLLGSCVLPSVPATASHKGREPAQSHVASVLTQLYREGRF